MQTSCFSRYTGNVGIAICLYPQRGWEGPTYNDLKPDKDTFFLIKAGQIDQDEYEERYFRNTLLKLNPQKVYDDLKDKVLLCWESPIFDNMSIVNRGSGFCHRHLVSKWIGNELGIMIQEWRTPHEIEKMNNSIPLF